MANKSFDDIIKSKLEHFSNEVEANAWELFQDSMANNDFDQEIVNKVDGHQLEVYPRDWDQLAEKLEKVEVPNTFDALIGAKLSGISLEEAPDWDQFEQILDQDINFDIEVSSKVKNHSVPSSDQHWPKLSAHLEAIEARRNRIVITKFIEAAIFILFVLTIMQLYPINNIEKTSPYRTVSVMEDLENNTLENRMAGRSGENENTNSRPEVGINNNAQVASTTSAADASLPVNTDLAFTNINDQRSPDVNSLSATEINASIPNRGTLAITEISSLKVTDLTNDLVSDLQKENLSQVPLLDENRIESDVFASNKNIAVAAKSEISNVKFAALEISGIDFERAEINFPVANTMKNIKKGQYWINTYGAPDMNFISTPYDIHLNTDAYQNGAYGYSVGTTISYETNNWEIESGLAYSSLNYHPREIIETTGSAFNGITQSTLKEIVMDIVEIPLNFKYKIFRKKGWTVYANSGLSVGAIASSDYIVESEFSPVFALSRRDGSKEGELRKKTFDPGLLKGGDLNNNLFATLNTGLGVSKKLSESISFYVQPTYYHNMTVKGLGPNNDVHNRLSMQIGTKVRL